MREGRHEKFKPRLAQSIIAFSDREPKIIYVDVFEEGTGDEMERG